MKINIRNERPEDYRKVEEVAREAFWNLYIPGATEHQVIHQMREHKDFIPELSFVIEVEDEIAGAIFYTHSGVVQKDGSVFKTISFGPVCIHPKYHRQGLGRQLITHSIEAAKEMGYSAILTLGYDYHYTPYGFLGGRKYGISMPDYQFYKGLLVLPLAEKALDQVEGYASFSESLEPDEATLEAYEATFPFKEKKVQPSQEEFALACAMLD